MRLSLSGVTVLILIFAFSQVSFGEDDFTISELQSKFARYVENSLPGVIDAEWKSPVDLWVEADGVDQSAATNIALDVIFMSKDELGQSFCVHVHNGDFKQIAMRCWSAP